MNKYKKYVVLQHDQKDCGCACLKMALRYYGGDANLEYLKEISGTNSEGTSLLGLIQASEKVGLLSEAYQASIEDIKKIKEPFFLHVELNGFLHYLICFDYHEKKGFTVVDPGIGLVTYSEEDLLEIWKDGYILIVKKEKGGVSLKTSGKGYLNWVLNMMKKDASYYISAVFLGIVIALLNMTTLVFTEKLIDVVLPSRSLSLLFKTLAIWFVLLLITIVLNYVRSIVLIQQAYNFNVRVFRFFFKRLLKMPKVFFDSKRQGDMIARMNDTERIQQNIKTIIADSFIQFFMIIVAVGFLIYYSVEVALIVLASFPILYLCSWLFNKKIKKLQHKMFNDYAQTESNYIDTISGIETIKVFNKESFYFKKNASFYKSFQNSILSLFKYEINQGTLIEICSTIISASGIAYAVLLVFNRVLEVGDLIAIISLIFMIIEGMKGIVQLNFEIFESKIAIERMFDFVERSDEIDEKKVSSNSKIIEDIQTISINNLSFSYPGQDFLITAANLTLNKGQITFLKGQSGSGKSTLSQLLLKFYKQNIGTITVNNNYLLESIETNQWRSQIAYVPQNIKIFNENILYNISLNDKKDDNEVMDFCRNELKIENIFSKFKDSYWTVLGEEGVTPSGGEKQIIAIARALFFKPKVLILDEATASMDSATQNRILEILDVIKKDMIILFITHNEELSSNNLANTYLLKDKIISLK
ncbi:peptidase domain-containing ABC transporter [Polaribacter sp. 11A2H]|uniref:peptidase domain-containing ABC transporter n=1 Tax=Polaribacter sp. 11A2H TaxID=2687290 RepID=UPI001409B505|nr:ABC transporter transmembrane domain-containing protein [Polaribacter sp. 11A2H]